MASLTPSALIVQLPPDFGRVLWANVALVLLKKKLAGNADNEYYLPFKTGRPVRLPYSLASDEAEAIAKELAGLGCLVKVVPSGE